MTTYYAILEVEEQASPAVIRQAYRRLVLLTHPDRTPDPAQHRRYLAVNEAYETLNDPTKRTAYDQQLRALRQPIQVPLPAAEFLHRDPALRRSSHTKRRAVPVPPVAVRYAAQFARLAPPMQLLAGVAIALVVLFWIDVYRLEAHAQHIMRLSCANNSCSIYTGRFAFQGPMEDLALGDQLTVAVSPWFGQIRLVTVTSGKMAGLQFRPANLYDDMWLLPLLLGVAAASVFWPKLSAEQLFNRAFTSVALLLIFLVFLALYG